MKSLTAQLLTPPGTAAIAVLQLFGTGTLQRLADSFSGQDLQTVPENRMFFSHWEIEGKRLDDILLVVRDHEREIIEVHCHAGRAVLEAARAGLEAFGFEWIENGTDLADENRFDPIQRLALKKLTNAKTRRAAALLLAQVNGALSKQIIFWIQQIESSSVEMEQLLMESHWVEALLNPQRVLITGPANAGKSTLMNRLVQETRAIVLDQPGTTRDLLRQTVALDGFVIEWVDTPGFLESSDPLDQQAIARIEEEQADLIFWMIDGTNPPEEIPVFKGPLFLGTNKIDLENYHGDPEGEVQFSALTGDGLDILKKKILNRLAGTPAKDELGPALFDSSIVQRVERALRYLREKNPKGAQEELEAVFQG